jgi:hypothetical protein
MKSTSTELIEEGIYLAKVTISLIEDDSPWSPHVAKEDIRKLDRVRLALRRGDIAAAKREAEVFELTPVG